MKSIEVELVYNFAKSKNYNVKLEEFMNIEDRMKIGEEDTDFDMTRSQLTITEERSQIVSFSNHIYKIGTSLVVRKDTITLTILDNEYNTIPDNKDKLLHKFGNKTVTWVCTFSNIYNYLNIKMLN